MVFSKKIVLSLVVASGMAMSSTHANPIIDQQIIANQIIANYTAAYTKNPSIAVPTLATGALVGCAVALCYGLTGSIISNVLLGHKRENVEEGEIKASLRRLITYASSIYGAYKGLAIFGGAAYLVTTAQAAQ